MSTNDLILIILNNPLIFMTKDYLTKNFLENNCSKGEVIPVAENEIPKIIIFKFQEESLIDKFISEYNNKPISNDINYNISLKKTKKSIEELKNEYENIKDLKPFQLYEDFENEWKRNYTNSPE
jgi:hypothetical protein